MCAHTYKSGTQTLTAGSWILDTLPQTKIAFSPPDNSGNVLATPLRVKVGKESGIEGVVRMSQVGDEGSNGGWLVEERGRDARGTEEDAVPGGARQDVLVLNSRVTDLEGVSRMLAKQVHEIVTEAFVNDTKTQDDLAASQTATDRSECSECSAAEIDMIALRSMLQTSFRSPLQCDLTSFPSSQGGSRSTRRVSRRASAASTRAPTR